MNARSGSLRSRLTSAEPGLRRAIIVFALVLLFYLPIESSVLAALPAAVYWPLRLLPDALVVLAAIAVVVIGDPRARSAPVRILWAVAAISVAIVAVNALRAIPMSDSVNAVRVLVRYLALGLLVWWAADGRRDVGSLAITAVLIAGAVQVGVAVIQIVIRAAESTRFDPVAFFFLDGTFGRYDRFGLFLMAVMLALVATTGHRDPRRFALLAACAALMYLSTSRQAMVGLGVGCAVLAIWPHVDRFRRGLAVGVAMLGIVMVLTSPSGWVPPTGEPEPGTTGESWPILGPSRPIKDSIELTTNPNRNFRLFYNLELAPWAAVTEPLIGFGPRQQVAPDPDPRLAARFESADIPWEWARNFTNDSNYASMVVQFGVIAPILFMLLLGGAMVLVARAEATRRDPIARFAVAFAVATMAVAWFGPAFEIRTISIILWVTLLGALAATRRRGGTPSPDSGPQVAGGASTA